MNNIRMGSISSPRVDENSNDNSNNGHIKTSNNDPNSHNGSSDNESASIGSASTMTTSGPNTSALLSSKNSKKGGGKKQKRPGAQGGSRSKNGPHNFEYICQVKENHGQPIFGCQFNHLLKPGEPLILATVGSNRVSIYECQPTATGGKLKVLYVFADPDSAENYYCCAWTEDENGKPLLAAAGARGIVRIISPSVAASVKHFAGHTNAINDLLFHPKDHNLLLSASKDHSLRLWNIKTDICVAIFGGVEGHRDEVLSADIDLTGSRIVSSGMDHSIKVWNLKKPKIENSIALSNIYDSKNSRPFPTVRQNYPDFFTRDMHRNYVDCTKWIGEFILSKSCENTIVCWKAGKAFQKWDELNKSSSGTTTFIFRLDIDDCEIWFIRFSLDFWKKTLAVGNQSGTTYIYDLSSTELSSTPTILTHPKCTTAIRQTALSRDGKVLICVCEDATIWRWDICEENRDNETNEKGETSGKSV